MLLRVICTICTILMFIEESGIVYLPRNMRKPHHLFFDWIILKCCNLTVVTKKLFTRETLYVLMILFEVFSMILSSTTKYLRHRTVEQ